MPEMIKRTPLPRPDIAVTPASDRDPAAPTGSHDIVISREGFSTIRSYRVGGGTTAEVVKDAVEQILNDPKSAEYIP